MNARSSLFHEILRRRMLQTRSDKSGSYDPSDPENPATSTLIYLSVGDFETARARAEEGLRIGPEEPYPLAAMAIVESVTGNRERAVQIARSALPKRLDDRWRSEFVFLRLLRNEAIESGSFDEAFAWYREYVPELFAEVPDVTVSNIQKAVDLAGLAQAGGESIDSTTLLEAVISVYDRQYRTGSANYPLGLAKAEALALLGRGDAAFAELDRVFDDGWRLLWRWDTEFNRNFDTIRDDPRFDAFVERVRRDIEDQVREFEASGLGAD